MSKAKKLSRSTKNRCSGINSFKLFKELSFYIQGEWLTANTIFRPCNRNCVFEPWTENVFHLLSQLFFCLGLARCQTLEHFVGGGFVKRKAIFRHLEHNFGMCHLEFEKVFHECVGSLGKLAGDLFVTFRNGQTARIGLPLGQGDHLVSRRSRAKMSGHFGQSERSVVRQSSRRIKRPKCK